MLHRVQAGFDVAAVEQALRDLPGWLAGRLLPHVRFYLGVDPIYAGLHTFAWSPGQTQGNDRLAHICFPETFRGGGPLTVVLPTDVASVYGEAEAPRCVLHELGHAADALSGFRFDVPPISEYAATDRIEAFAEAFSYLHAGYLGYEELAREELGRDGVAAMQATLAALR